MSLKLYSGLSVEFTANSQVVLITVCSFQGLSDSTLKYNFCYYVNFEFLANNGIRLTWEGESRELVMNVHRYQKWDHTGQRSRISV